MPTRSIVTDSHRREPAVKVVVVANAAGRPSTSSRFMSTMPLRAAIAWASRKKMPHPLVRQRGVRRSTSPANWRARLAGTWQTDPTADRRRPRVPARPMADELDVGIARTPAAARAASHAALSAAGRQDSRSQPPAKSTSERGLVRPSAARAGRRRASTGRRGRRRARAAPSTGKSIKSQSRLRVAEVLHRREHRRRRIRADRPIPVAPAVERIGQHANRAQAVPFACARTAAECRSACPPSGPRARGAADRRPKCCQ